MKKDTIRAVIVAAVFLIIYHLIVFLVPFPKTAVFWISYVFTLLAFGLVAIAFYIALLKNPDAKSRFYGFPIARIGVLYGIAQLAVSFLLMVLGVWIPWWLALLVYAIGLGAAVLGLISTEVVAEESRVLDATLKKNVTLMRSLQSKVNQMATQCDVEAVKKFAEEIRYSDPVSSEALSEAEAELSALIDELQLAVVDGEEEPIRRLCQKASAALAERNRLCKLHK